MSDESKHLPLRVGSDASGPEAAAAPRQKLWVTPKVITSTLVDDDTASSNNAGGDGNDNS